MVAGLVVVALLVIVIVLSTNGSRPRGPLQPPDTAAPSSTAIRSVSVFHLERDADDAAAAAKAADGDPSTAWTTDRYFGPHFANLRRGLGLAITLDGSQKLHTLTVTSPTVGWSAEVFVADSVPSPPSLAPWGPPVASKQLIGGDAAFNLGGRQGRVILLWLTELGSTNQATVAELAVR